MCTVIGYVFLHTWAEGPVLFLASLLSAFQVISLLLLLLLPLPLLLLLPSSPRYPLVSKLILGIAHITRSHSKEVVKEGCPISHAHHCSSFFIVRFCWGHQCDHLYYCCHYYCHCCNYVADPQMTNAGGLARTSWQ